AGLVRCGAGSGGRHEPPSRGPDLRGCEPGECRGTPTAGLVRCGAGSGGRHEPPSRGPDLRGCEPGECRGTPTAGLVRCGAGSGGGKVMRVSQAARVLNAHFIGGDVEFAAVNSDSRAIRRGDLFVALKGERFDGNLFVAEAAAAGAAAALVDAAGARTADRSSGAPIPLLVVADTLKALGQLAHYWRRQFDVPLVALTGSNGKTTVKEMLAAILREAVNTGSPVQDPKSLVLASRGNLNNHIGVPLTLLELRREHRYAVIEMGMNHAGEISYITRLAEPNVALINNSGVAHIENFGSAEAIA